MKRDQEEKKDNKMFADQVNQRMKAHEAESRRLEAIGAFEQGVNPAVSHQPNSISRSETIAEFENRINQQMAETKILEDIREQDEAKNPNDGDDELTPTVVRHPHLLRHLQKTDSRIAMYGGEPFYDVDLNPSLKSVEN
ncbi:hypothetical protein L596_004542 [Steinernema carpocapsae]|uniref:Uncharacterized protein n=1 Tax=Steinernema carpocapsae TaxID=34508 RepID=A0A4U8UX67_STECR|nr:hypothetical protein L596_004542 [Steinernema carpocapsae]